MSMRYPGYVPRLNFGRRLEPIGDVVLHGAGQSPEAFRQYFGAIGERKPALSMTYVDLRDDLSAYFQSLDQELDQYLPWSVVPQIGLIMTGGADTDHHPEQHYEHDVAAGRYDDQIETFCAGLRRLNRPAYVRIGFEFNGSWFGYQPEPYKAAWVRIVSALRRHALDDVAAVWCYYPLPSQREHPAGVDRDYVAYYPGDEHVDWWAIDLFDAGPYTSDNALAFLADARSRGYPVMIGESTPRWVGGVQGGEATWNAWFVPYFDFIRTQPAVKAFCYISWDWTEYPIWQVWGEARMWANPIVLERYQRELADPLFCHAPIRQGH